MNENQQQNQDMKALLYEHTTQEDKRFENIENQLTTIRENHLYHIENDVQTLKMQGASIATDLGWLRWGMLAILGALIAGSIGLIFIR